MPRLLANVALAIASVLLAIGIAEFASGLVPLPPGFSRVHSLQGSPTREVGGVVLWQHAEPRADVESLSAARVDGVFQILGLGDSILFGVGLAADQTYLEEARRSLAESGREVRIINLATPGFNTMQENAAYAEVADRVAPDLVIVHYWADDARQYRVFDGHVVDFGDMDENGDPIQALPLPRAVNEYLLLHSRVYRLVTYLLVARQGNPAAADWNRVAEPLLEIHRRAARQGARLLVLASPGLARQRPEPNPDLFSLRRLAQMHDFEVLDLAEWLAGVSAASVAMDPVHFNAEGHRILGERLVQYLLRRDLNGETDEVAD